MPKPGYHPDMAGAPPMHRPGFHPDQVPMHGPTLPTSSRGTTIGQGVARGLDFFFSGANRWLENLSGGFDSSASGVRAIGEDVEDVRAVLQQYGIVENVPGQGRIARALQGVDDGRIKWDAPQFGPRGRDSDGKGSKEGGEKVDLKRKLFRQVLDVLQEYRRRKRQRDRERELRDRRGGSEGSPSHQYVGDDK